MEFWLIQHLLIVAGLAAGAWVCERWGRLSPAAMHLVWLVVLIKFMTPPFIYWPTDRLTTWVVPLFRADDPTADSPQSTVNPPVEFEETSPLLPDEAGLVPADATLENSEHELRDDGSEIADEAPEVANDRDAATDSAPARNAPTIADGAMADREPATSVEPEETVPAATALLSTETEPLDREKYTDRFHPLQWLWSAWLAGSIVCMGFYWRRVRQWNAVIARGRAPSEELLSRLESWCRPLKLRPPRVVVSDEVIACCLVCLRRTVLLWPAQWDRFAVPDGDHLVTEAPLVHELAHLRRRDHWVSRLETLAACVWWWNPLFFVVARKVREHAELASDLWVVQMLPEQRREYAHLLLDLVDERRLRPLAVGILPATRRKAVFHRRLKMVMQSQHPSRVSYWFAGLILVLLALAVPTFSLTQRAESQENDPFGAGRSEAAPALPVGAPPSVINIDGAGNAVTVPTPEPITSDSGFATNGGTIPPSLTPYADDSRAVPTPPAGVSFYTPEDPDSTFPEAGNPFGGPLPLNSDATSASLFHPFNPASNRATVPTEVVNLSEISTMLTLINDNFVGDVQHAELVEAAMTAMASRLGSDCEYLIPERYHELLGTIENQGDSPSLVGLKLGIESGRVVVLEVLPGSSASEAGVEAGATIEAIGEGNQRIELSAELSSQMTEGQRLAAAVRALRGDVGTLVSVTFRHTDPNEADKLATLMLERRALRREAVHGFRRTEDGVWDFWATIHDPDVGYVRIAQFETGVSRRVGMIVHNLHARGVTRLILDLRDCRGGSLDEAVATADLFMGSGTILSVTGRTGDARFTADEDVVADMEIVVLVNENTSSAAEVVAAALQDSEADATIIGEPTAGKGTVSSIYPIGNERGEVQGALKLATAQFIRPNGEPIQRPENADASTGGVQPDRVVTLSGSAEAGLRERFVRCERGDVAPMEGIFNQMRPIGSGPDPFADTQFEEALQELQRPNTI